MKLTLDQLRETILPMIKSMPISYDVRSAGGVVTVSIKGDYEPLANAIVELIKQDREARDGASS
jgi:hypothetical protein